MNKVYILIGGNLGNRTDNISVVKQQIEKRCGRIVAQSSIYETAPWGVEDQPNYLNQALLLMSSIAPERLMAVFLDIEKSLGRERHGIMGARTMDIDILMIDGQMFDTDILKVPHPHLTQRRFALVPLAEIGAELIHPRMNMTIQDLLNICSDPLAVEKFELQMATKQKATI